MLKVGLVVIRLDIRKLIKDANFDNKTDVREKAAGIFFKPVIINFLENKRDMYIN